MTNCIVCGKEDIGAHGCVNCAITFREKLFANELARKDEESKANQEAREINEDVVRDNGRKEDCLNGMDLYKIIRKLVGPVRPVGETREDERRLENMKNLTELTDRLLFDIADVAHNADRVEASMKAIGEHARDFVASVKDT